ncbi:MAG TPA: LysR family transcriptional regulator [Caulobacteraceae bacterium]|jgi:DNA-binding transcriptional LysR family regulator|nr:LysR family transcriptional regulator [Caulobacteraceae bacterium]
MAEPDWSLYRTFLAVLDAGSLSGAARALGLAQPTVGRQIEALEAALGGEALFTRSPGGLAPTRAALTLAPHAQAMAAAAGAFVRAAAGTAQDMSGVVRITASDIVGAEVLPPILAGFREAWPAIDIELLCSNRNEDLLRRDADIAVRMSRPTQGSLLARKIGEISLIFYGHRSYLQKHGAPRTLEDLAGHTLIGYDRIPLDLEGLGDLPIAVSREMFALRTDNDLAALALLRAGAGLTPCQRTIAERDPNLTPLLEGQFELSLPVWVVMHEDLKGDRRLRAMFDHLVAGLGEYVRG